MHTFTDQEKAKILKDIRRDGYMISGWCRRNKIDTSLFYEVINNDKGHGKKPSPVCDKIVELLIRDGYLKIDQDQAA